ncbi:hypothetical protein EELLY_v1c04570 [Entomoplasma ellychniae]|uniref:Uncharacterized protein n=1 Tax=Entomoplasma ellychniae TaxID=2114 RepID=A0A8E2QW48_9MOLU|nr:hypothetical protein [Entomoplasma ellychniae]PPE04777.1 hypothetical protein EELLY_v1c04570 [Entomoplasma ellychniae]
MKKILAISSTILITVSGTLALTAATSFVTKISSRKPNDEIKSFNKVISNQIINSQKHNNDENFEQILFLNNQELKLEKVDVRRELDSLFYSFFQNK